MNARHAKVKRRRRGLSRRDWQERQRESVERELALLEAARAATDAERRGRVRLRRRWLWISALSLVTGLALWFAVGREIVLQTSDLAGPVNALRQDVVYVDPAVMQTVDVDAVRRAIADRPIAMMVLAGGSPLSAHPGDTCSDVVDRFDGLILTIVVDGEFAYGCESDDLPLTANTTWMGWDFAQWVGHDNAVRYLDGDLVGQANELAVRYDASVADGDLQRDVRTYEAPPVRWLAAIGIVLAVVTAVAAIFLGSHRLLASWQRRRAIRSLWLDVHDDLELELAEVAMTLLDLPERPSSPDAVAALSVDYLQALDDWERAQPVDDLVDLQQRVERLTTRADSLRTAQTAPS